MYTAMCAGCNREFETPNLRKTRCKSKCGIKRASKLRNKTRTKKSDMPMQFIGVDGEAHWITRYVTEWLEDDNGELYEVTVPCKSHEYVLLSVGDQSLHFDGKRELTHHEIFPFLYEQFEANPDACFVGFFLGYDFAQWFKSLDDLAGWKLLTKAGQEYRRRRNSDIPHPFPLIADGWEFDIMPNMKRFKIRPHVPYERRTIKITNHKDGTATASRPHPHQWMHICDTGPYFQSSFLSVIEPRDKKGNLVPDAVVSDAEFARVKEGKEARSDAGFDQDMIDYNLLENEILARVMSNVDQGLRADGIKLTRDKWYGPGQAAQAWMALEQCPTAVEVGAAVPPWALDAARQTYYGGWFEITTHGAIPGKTYAYDINSAYPTIINKLPCLLHGTWTQGIGTPTALPEGDIRILNASVEGDNPTFGAMPHRRAEGTILRPHRTAGQYWQHEVEASIRAGLIKAVRTRRKGGPGIPEAIKAGGLIVESWVQYSPCDCLPPLRAISALYEGRLAVGKNTAFGKSKKVVYNSAYGKLAQSIGTPRFANPIWASLITAGCRSMILDAIATHPSGAAGVAMVATDSVTFFEPHPTIDIDAQRLGAWDETVHSNLSLLMPGLYWDDQSRQAVREGKAPRLKSRGVSGRDLAKFIDDIDVQWIAKKSGGMGEDAWPAVTIPIMFAMVGAKLAAARNAWRTCGMVTVWDWDDNGHILSRGEERELSAAPTSKRCGFYLDHDTRPGEVLIRTRAWADVDGEPRSWPYGKAFGMEAVIEAWHERMLNEMMTPHGTVLDAIRAVLPTKY